MEEYLAMQVTCRNKPETPIPLRLGIIRLSGYYLSMISSFISMYNSWSATALIYYSTWYIQNLSTLCHSYMKQSTGRTAYGESESFQIFRRNNGEANPGVSRDGKGAYGVFSSFLFLSFFCLRDVCTCCSVSHCSIDRSCNQYRGFSEEGLFCSYIYIKLFGLKTAEYPAPSAVRSFWPRPARPEIDYSAWNLLNLGAAFLI